MSKHYDRRGEPMDLLACAEKFEDVDYKRVVVDILPNGKCVSTVWLGLDHRRFGDGPPLIFETMVFPYEGNLNELDMRQYSTEDEARTGHAEMIEKWV